MRRDLIGAVRLLALPTIVLVGVAVVAPGYLVLSARIYALLVGVAAIAVLVLGLRRAYPRETPLRDAERTPSRDLRPTSLARLEHETTLAAVSAFDVHYRLVPRVRGIAAGLLTSRRQVSLETSPEKARVLLGEEAWALVRPDRPAPEDRLGNGMTPSELARIVDTLEAI